MNKKVICTDIEGKKYKINADKLSFRPSVYSIIVKNNNILLSKQWGGYDFPGGGIKLGETIENALIREVKEETGLNVKTKQAITSQDSFFKLPYENKFVHSILMYYVCEIISGKITKKFLKGAEKEYADKPEWISLSDIKKIKFYNSVDSPIIIEKAINLLKPKS